MELKEFLRKYDKLAIAFSGGTDSAYLLYAALDAGCDVCAYFVKSEFTPRFEIEDAERLANELGVTLKLLELNLLADERVRANGARRCYYCKKQIMQTISDAARRDAYYAVADGTNASDKEEDRPGMQALKEASVISPLRICGIDKATIRQLSREAGLFTWNKPAYACLATRIPTGTRITEEVLQATEICENEMINIGFKDFRIRNINGTAKIQVTEDQLPLIINNRTEITEKLKQYYNDVTLDLEVRKQ